MTEEHLRSLKAEIAERLRTVCETWPPEMFAAMVDRIASITVKYEHGGGLTSYDRRGAERMINEMKAVTERTDEGKKSPGP